MRECEQSWPTSRRVMHTSWLLRSNQVSLFVELFLAGIKKAWRAQMPKSILGSGNNVLVISTCLTTVCRTSDESFVDAIGVSKLERDRGQQLPELCTLSLPQPGGLTAAQKGRVWVAAALTAAGADGHGWLLCSGYGGEQSGLHPMRALCVFLVRLAHVSKSLYHMVSIRCSFTALQSSSGARVTLQPI